MKKKTDGMDKYLMDVLDGGENKKKKKAKLLKGK